MTKLPSYMRCKAEALAKLARMEQDRAKAALRTQERDTVAQMARNELAARGRKPEPVTDER